jgi:hypothetical protein
MIALTFRSLLEEVEEVKALGKVEGGEKLVDLLLPTPLDILPPHFEF